MRGDIALFLGLVTVIGGAVIVAIFLLLGSDGGGSNACANPLPPLGESDISQLGFQAEDAGMARVIQAASVSNLEAANEAFYANNGEIHNFSHNIDASLREVDEELATELCETVITLEEALFSEQPDLLLIASEATRARDLLRDAAEALGYARPGG
jgi:hypothetical protein